MDDYESLSHTKWDCKYHVVFIPKCRRRTLYGELRRHLGEVFRKLVMQKECRIEEGHLMPANAAAGFQSANAGRIPRRSSDRTDRVCNSRTTSGSSVTFPVACASIPPASLFLTVIPRSAN